MPPHVHPTHSHRTHRQNSRVFPTRFPRPGQHLKRHHHGRPRIGRSSPTPNSNPLSNAGRRAIFRHTNTLAHLLKGHLESPDSCYPKHTATRTYRRAPNVLSRTITEGAIAHPTCINTEGDRGTCKHNTRQSPTQTCVHHPSPMYTATNPNTCHHRARP